VGKSQFQRIKPHVNVGTLYQRIQGLGFTSLGARQIINGELVTDPYDRQRIAAALSLLTQGPVPVSMEQLEIAHEGLTLTSLA